MAGAPIWTRWVELVELDPSMAEVERDAPPSAASTLGMQRRATGVLGSGTTLAESCDERPGGEVTLTGVEASSAVAQAVLNEGGHALRLREVMVMMEEMQATVVQVKQEVRISNVTLGSLAMNELDCPRLVFITPFTPPERRSVKCRIADKLTRAVPSSCRRRDLASWQHQHLLKPAPGEPPPSTSRWRKSTA